MKLIPAILASLALGASLAACSEDEPAVCSSADQLRSSVDSVQDIELDSSAAIGDLQSGLSSIGDDLAEVKSDAPAEFSTEVDAVEGSYANLTSSVKDAKASASAETLAATGKALSTLGTDVQKLVDDVQSTC